MDEHTAQHLNNINRAFYAAAATPFERLRRGSWAGWLPLLPQLEVTLSEKKTLTVLDVGCGNGRFGVFLAQHINARTRIQYRGIDSNPALLDHARSSLRVVGVIDTTLEVVDILDAPLPDGPFDVVALFGVMHHIPASARRLALIQTLAERVAPGGLLALACWRFYEYARFREKISAWSADLAARVERHDYLLDWQEGTRAIRYCHYVDESEHAALIAASGLHEVAAYRADGEDGAMNRYSLLRRL